MRPQIKFSKNMEIKIHSDTNWKNQLIYMKVQVHSSSELPLEDNENQKPLSNQSWLWPNLIKLRVKRILCSFNLVIKGKEDKCHKCQTPSQVNIFIWTRNLIVIDLIFFIDLICHFSTPQILSFVKLVLDG